MSSERAEGLPEVTDGTTRGWDTCEGCDGPLGSDFRYLPNGDAVCTRCKEADEPLTDCEDICMDECQGPCGVFS